MAELTAMRLARGKLKGRVTRFATWLNSFDPLRGDFGSLQSRLDEALPIMAQFNELQDQIEMVDEEADHETERLNFEDSYHATIGKAKLFLQRSNSATPSSVITNQTGTMDNPIISSGIKLPTMSLPTFDGNYDQWLNFRDTFKAIIHDNPSIADIQKFYYLRSSLKDNAAEVINSLTASAENYKIAWEMLTKRFNNSKLMISRQFQLLVETPSLQKESGPALRQMLDHVQKLSRSLKILQANTWDALFTYHIITKMDNTTKREWKSFTKDIEMPTEEQLIEFLEERCSIVDTDVVAKTLNKPNSSSDSRHTKPRRGNHSFTGVSTDSVTCKMCEGAHEVFRCPVFRNLSVASRTTEAKKHKLCMNCLRLHSGRCSFGRCRKCNKFHNSLLHVDLNKPTSDARESNAPTPDPVPTQVAANNSQPSGSSGGANTAQATAPFTGAVETVKSQVLLSTALLSGRKVGSSEFKPQ